VKTNIGHLDTAAGVASLIKATLALQHGEMPPSLNFEAPNPRSTSSQPVRVNDQPRDWPRGDTPRRAGVNSLGVGGTNAFVVLEEAPERRAEPEGHGRRSR
jgi:acyl transferase domain-containing protein